MVSGTGGVAATTEQGARGRAALVVAILVIALMTLVQGRAEASTTLTAPTAVAATARPDGSALVTWNAIDEPGRQLFVIFSLDETLNKMWGNRIADTSARSAVVDELVPGHTYLFSVGAGGNGYTSSAGVLTAPVTMPLGACAGVAGSCVGVDTSAAAGVAHPIATGLLHGVTASTPTSLLSGLTPSAWRIDAYDAARFQLARAAGGSITLLLSDAFMRNNWTGSHLVENPWDDWNAYATAIQDAVRWHQAAGLLPDYWDIQNEPNNPNYYSPATPPTRALVLQQFQVAHDAIRQILPDAKIAGPSLAEPILNNTAYTVDMMSFLDYAVAHNLHFDAITWHELGNASTPGSFEGSARSVTEHASQIQTLIDQRPSLGHPELFVNEYGAAWDEGNPGAEVGYIAALERSGLVSAVHACWLLPQSGVMVDTCYDPRGLLDGLVSTTAAPTPAWWVHHDYDAMTGTKVFAEGNDAGLPAFASVTSTGETRVLVGHDQGCVPSLTVWCPSGSPLAPPLTPTLAVRVPAGASTYYVTVRRIPYLLGSLSSETVTLTTKVGVSNGVLLVKLPSMASGDAASVQLVPLVAQTTTTNRYR